MGGLSRGKVKMRFRNRICRHGGQTPRLVPAQPVRPGDRRRAEPCGGKPQQEEAEPPMVEPPITRNAVVPVLIREEALDIAREKRKRRFRVLEPEERIVSGSRSTGRYIG